MFRVGDVVVQSTTQPHRFRVGDFIIINPELISEFRTGKFPSDSGIILKNGEFYDGELKYGCVILSIANDEVNQYYNSERYCLDANLAMVILGEECRHTVAIRPTDMIADVGRIIMFLSLRKHRICFQPLFAF